MQYVVHKSLQLLFLKKSTTFFLETARTFLNQCDSVSEISKIIESRQNFKEIEIDEVTKEMTDFIVLLTSGGMYNTSSCIFITCVQFYLHNFAFLLSLFFRPKYLHTYIHTYKQIDAMLKCILNNTAVFTFDLVLFIIKYLKYALI